MSKGGNVVPLPGVYLDGEDIFLAKQHMVCQIKAERRVATLVAAHQSAV